MNKILNFGSRKRHKVMRPSYINARLEDLAHDMSVAVWVFYSPHSTKEEKMKATKLLDRFIHRVNRYRKIKDCGGMEAYLTRYDEARFDDFVSEAEMMINNN